MIERLHIFNEVARERERQFKKWGTQAHVPPFEWMSILVEEVGEAAQAFNDKEPGHARTELVQVAAVAVAIIESLDLAGNSRRAGASWSPTPGGLKVAVEAERREAEVGRPFIAALLRVVSETYITREGLEAKVKAAREDEREAAKDAIATAKETARGLAKRIQDFEQRVGVSFPREDYSWAKPNLEDFSRAFRVTLLAEKVQDETARALARTADGLRLSLETVERVINGIPKPEPEPEEDQE